MGFTISKILGGELQPSCRGSPYVCKKKCFPRLIKVEKMMSSLKILQQDELREEVSFEAARKCQIPDEIDKQNVVSFKRKSNSHKVSSSRSNYWISNSQAFCSSCGARISQMCKHLAS